MHVAYQVNVLLQPISCFLYLFLTFSLSYIMQSQIYTKEFPAIVLFFP